MINGNENQQNVNENQQINKYYLKSNEINKTYCLEILLLSWCPAGQGRLAYIEVEKD